MPKTLKMDNGKNAILVKFSEKECAPGHVPLSPLKIQFIY
jgi:hypothetical protein